MIGLQYCFCFFVAFSCLYFFSQSASDADIATTKERTLNQLFLRNSKTVLVNCAVQCFWWWPIKNTRPPPDLSSGDMYLPFHHSLIFPMIIFCKPCILTTSVKSLHILKNQGRVIWLSGDAVNAWRLRPCALDWRPAFKMICPGASWVTELVPQGWRIFIQGRGTSYSI